jgi:hypothetical protein
MDNLMILTPAQHTMLRSEMIERTSRRLLPHVSDGNSREDRADARNTARIEAGRIVDDLLSLLVCTPARLAQPSLKDLIASVR